MNKPRPSGTSLSPHEERLEATAAARNTIRLVTLLFGLVAPTVITWLYFVRLAEAAQPIPQVAYAAGKAIQFALPLGWLALGGRGLWPHVRPRRHQMVQAILIGSVISVLGLIAVFGWLLPTGSLDVLVSTSRERQAAFGIDSLATFVVFALFYALFHSGLEEWYWRGFVLGGLLGHLPRFAAIGVAALAFGSHHVLLLVTLFGGATPIALLLSAAVILGGVIWSVMREKHGHLYGAWLSHGIVDAAIFMAGWWLVSPN